MGDSRHEKNRSKLREEISCCAAHDVLLVRTAPTNHTGDQLVALRAPGSSRPVRQPLVHHIFRLVCSSFTWNTAHDPLRSVPSLLYRWGSDSSRACNGNGVFQVIGALLDMPCVCYASDARGYWAGEYCEKCLPLCDPASNCTQCVEYEDWVSINGVVQQLVDAVQVLSSNVSTLQSAIAGNAHDIASLLANDAVLTRWFSTVLGAPAEFWQAATTGESRELGAINSKFCVLSASRMAAYQGTGFDFTCRLTTDGGQWTLQSSSSGPNLTIVCESLCWTLPQF
eukprot:ANDGO_08454.mRNA.1 hypothetical protein